MRVKAKASLAGTEFEDLLKDTRANINALYEKFYSHAYKLRQIDQEAWNKLNKIVKDLREIDVGIADAL